MKTSTYLFTAFISATLLITSCGPPPEWKQKGFKSEEEFLKDQEKQKWLISEDKFLGRWKYKVAILVDLDQVFKLQILEDGYGKFEETQGIGYSREDNFNWKKIDNTTIEVSNLQGEYDPFKQSYNFKRFNGKYTIDYTTGCLTLRDTYEFCK